ncbi:hypothetical protein KY290_029792 [Solanum tuberosum]|uniref:DUF4216 domain-containing protein n=1 Tax=Solanum tuberosum TaxID=4113 RepID=A0ABQ7ULR1_SOLTU|nr:hypothetical protein KY290_029792 [Solanum tuberosum]
MTWHKDERVDDEIMRHPADSMAWKSFDELHPSFALDPRNVRLGLTSDGFQPFRNSKTSHSIWPVVLIPYNLPPWLCMKQENFILSMIIPGPNGPGDAIDTYLQPLIEELKELWEVGIETYDASTRQNFKLHASLLWTINDFPAYGNLSGWSTKGKLACPCCKKDTSSIRLTNRKKQCFMGHRRYLPLSHKWRKETKTFDGNKEERAAPKICSGIEILDQVQDLEGIQLSKDPKKRKKISHEKRQDNWNKKSIFSELPYWKCLLLRHNLDVMHIEKNICDNIMGTIMNVQGKTKDTIKTRLDLQEMNIRSELHPIQNGEKIEVPTACYTLSPEDKHKLCLFLKNLKVAQLHKGDDSRMMEDLLSISRGPTQYLRRSNGYVVNGYRFHIEDYDKKLRTQNCGVVVLGENDKDSENLDYYGVLTNVIELQFLMDIRVVLFRCNWFDVYDEIKGVKKDEYDFVSVNPGRFLKINEPFVLANQASQVFYANDNSNKGWEVVMKTQPRDSFEIIEQMNDEVVELGSPSQKKRKRTSEVQDETSQD